MPILVFLNDAKSFCVEADSLDFTTGAVLSQQSEVDSKWHLIAFFSKFLSPVKQNYKTHDKKILVIIYALEEWKYFLKGVASLVEI